MKLSSIVSIVLFAYSQVAYGQFSKPEEKFPNGENYIYPINPGKPGSLAGTMGELRTTHFHSGIDIRTNNVIGFPVLASKSGYISRVSVSPSGYGNVLYITHADGHTTLYAHLDKFKGRLADHVLKEQYKQKTANIDLYFKEGEFKVKQGDTVALSGNSGSSGGPHLHFDIRDPNNYALDPLKVVAFPEITDNLPPAVEKIALKTLDINSRINDKFGRHEFYAQRTGNDFVFTAPILATGSIGVEILAKDRLAPGSPFWGGVNHIDVHVDDKLIFSQSIDKINIAETRSIFTLMDFRTMRVNGNRFYKLYIDDGNQLNFYTNSPSTGKIKVPTDKEARVKITMKDSYGNASNISFRLMPSMLTKEVKMLEPMKTPIEYDVIENTIMVSVPPCLRDSNRAIIYSKNASHPIEPAYTNVHRAVYLIDLRKEIPDSIVTCESTVRTNIKTVVPSGQKYSYFSDIMDIEFPQDAVYDTVYLTTYHGITEDSLEVFNIGTKTDPLNKSINVTLRPSRSYKWDKTHAVYRRAGKGFTYLGGGWENGGVYFATREFGDFVILRDVIPPTIKPVSVNNHIARFKIKDNLSGIDKFEANINGQWLLMHYDAKTATIWSEKLNKAELLKGKFTLVVTDNAGNEARYTKQIP